MLANWCKLVAALLVVHATIVGAGHMGSGFPLRPAVAHAQFNAAHAPAPTQSSVSRHSYLITIHGIVSHFRQYLDREPQSPTFGQIIDPYEGKEIQYATPCFAHAAATLLEQAYIVSEREKKAWLADITIAMTTALRALRNGPPVNGSLSPTCAQSHCNFYTAPLMAALKILTPIVVSWLFSFRLVLLTKRKSLILEHRVQSS
eukprot:m.633934 g.633934  ORF g.633934 m.633934 type:complete len:203 (-) comp58300_c0_seq34:1598-2206(-)